MELEPVLAALGGWGIRYMAQRGDGDEFRSHWFAYPLALFLRDQDPRRAAGDDRTAQHSTPPR